MNLEVRPVGNLRLIHHKECGSQVLLGLERVIFCPTCRVTEDGTELKAVLCCDECDTRLPVTEDRGSYCIGCGYAPSLQDTFFERFD